MTRPLASLPLLLAATFAAAAHAAPPEPAPLRQPAGKWVVDYGETRCNAARAYGEGKEAARLALRPSPGGSVVVLMLLRPRRGPDAEHFRVTTSITPAGTRTTGLRFATRDRKGEVIWINVDRTALDALPRAGEIAISARGVIDERFALPDIGAVLKALDTCNADLRAHWNADGVATGSISKPAASLKPLASYITDEDYPAQAINESAGGTTASAIMVDEKGAPKDCVVEETSGIATLDAQACILFVARARFTPALDAAGKPVRSVVTSRVRWVVAG